jgi:hypothetical protein
MSEMGWKIRSLLLLSATLTFVGCQSGVTNIPVSPNSELGKQMLELDAKGRAFQNAPSFSQAMIDFEMARAGNCTNVVFDHLQEPGLKINRYTRLYTMTGKSLTCGNRLYCAKITFDDSANTVAKQVEIIIGSDDELGYGAKAAEFIRYAQAGDVQQMLKVTSSLTHATETDSVRTVYAEQVVPQFQDATVTWNSESTPTIDEKKHVGLVFTGTAQGKKTFSFDVAVYKENGDLVIANIQKHH